MSVIRFQASASSSGVFLWPLSLHEQRKSPAARARKPAFNFFELPQRIRTLTPASRRPLPGGRGEFRCSSTLALRAYAQNERTFISAPTDSHPHPNSLPKGESKANSARVQIQHAEPASVIGPRLFHSQPRLGRQRSKTGQGMFE